MRPGWHWLNRNGVCRGAEFVFTGGGRLKLVIAGNCRVGLPFLLASLFSARSSLLFRSLRLRQHINLIHSFLAQTAAFWIEVRINSQYCNSEQLLTSARLDKYFASERKALNRQLGDIDRYRLFTMADGMCGPSNPLQNFQKHSTVDRTLQQDRLISRPSPSQVSLPFAQIGSQLTPLSGLPILSRSKCKPLRPRIRGFSS